MRLIRFAAPLLLTTLVLSGCGSTTSNTAGDAPPTSARLTAAEQNYIDALHSLGNAYPFRMTLNTPTLVWIGNRYCDIVQEFGPSNVLQTDSYALESFSGSQQGAAFIQAEANHWLCPGLAYLNLPASPRPGGRSGLEVGTIPNFPSSGVAPNPALPAGWPSDNALPTPARVEDLSDEDRALVRQISNAGTNSPDRKLLASAAHEACHRAADNAARSDIAGELMLLYAGLSYNDASHVYAVATSRLCNTTRAATPTASGPVGTAGTTQATRGPNAGAAIGDRENRVIQLLGEHGLPSPERWVAALLDHDGLAGTCHTLETGDSVPPSSSAPSQRWRWVAGGLGQSLLSVYGVDAPTYISEEMIHQFVEDIATVYCPDQVPMIGGR